MPRSAGRLWDWETGSRAAWRAADRNAEWRVSVASVISCEQKDWNRREWKAIAGELVPQDPADEPCDALQARIRAEREAFREPPSTKMSMIRRLASACISLIF